MADTVQPRTLPGFMELMPKEQMLFEKIEKKKAFAATAHSNQNFDEIMASCLNKFVQKDVSFDGHRNFLTLKFCAHARKFKMLILYHILLVKSTSALNLSRSFQKRKICS